jgi:hypothetical protein
MDTSRQSLSLEPRINELRRQGFTVISETDEEVLAVLNKWRWNLSFCSTVTVVLLCKTERLTAERLAADRRQIESRWSELDPSIWPAGFQKARFILPIYLTDTIDEEALTQLHAQPPVAFSTFYVAAAMQSDDEVIRYETRPSIGMLLYELTEFTQDRLTDPPQGPASFDSALGTVMAVLFAFCLCVLVCVPLAMVAVALIAIGALMILVALGALTAFAVS